MEYIISCRLTKDPNEIYPNFYYFAGIRPDGVRRFDTRKEVAEVFEDYKTAEACRQTLLTCKSVVSCVIERVSGGTTK